MIINSVISFKFMNKSELTEDSIALSKIYNAGQSNNKKGYIAKQNDAKYMNAIRPYVKERKISKRESHKNISASIPIDSKNKSKKSDKNLEDSASKIKSDIYSQLMALKADYKNLKINYTALVRENSQLTQRTQRESSDMQKIRKQLEKCRKQNQNHQSNVQFLEKQIQRIKKECFRLLDAEKFQNKKLQETIQQKQLMIAYLRSQLAVLHGDNPNHGFFFQHTAPSGTHPDASKNYLLMKAQPPQTKNQANNQSQIQALSKISINQSLLSNLLEGEIQNQINLPKQMPQPKKQTQTQQINQKPKREYIFSNEDDSLNFSINKSKEEMDSIISISEPTILTFTKKDVYEYQQGSEESQIQCTEGYTGEEEILTFQNRFGGNNMIVDSIPNTSKIRHEESKITNKQKVKGKGLQISIDQHNGGKLEQKQLSSETGKKNVKINKSYNALINKNGKGKKIKAKKKSQEVTIQMRK